MVVPSEIVLPETKPETEWVHGRALQKVSPTYRHGRLQSMFCQILSEWAKGRGRVASEWRFRVNPPGERVRPLVPDVAYLSYEHLPLVEDEAAQVPLGVPDVAVEILSPGDRSADLEDKVATYMRAGCGLIVLVDPQNETIAAIEQANRVLFRRDSLFEHPALDGLTIEVSRFFDDARR